PGHLQSDPEYALHAWRHYEELIERYEPRLLWNDVGYPITAEAGTLIDTFHMETDGVVNDRFDIFDLNPFHPRLPKDFVTRERTAEDSPSVKWELCKSIGQSFGYNANENEADWPSSEKLLHELIDVVSRGGNLLLNVGPKPNGEIPVGQQTRLLEMGTWLGVNG